MLSAWVRKYGYRTQSIWTMLTGFDQPLQTVAMFLGQAKPGNKLLRVRRSGLEFTVRGVWDTWTVKETVLDHCYEAFGYTFQPGWTFVDIGGFIGDFAIVAATRDPGNRVFSFEPFPESLALFRENARRNQVPNIEILEMAVSGDGRPLAMDRSSGEPLMFECIDVSPDQPPDQDVTASTSLAAFMDDRGIDRIDYLKLDCEGGEYDILLNAPQPVLDRIQRIVMEYHDHLTPHRHGELVCFLKGAGFVVDVFPSRVRPETIGYLRAARAA